MRKNWKEEKILILGSGGLRIGQAGEFDYSGSQAIKALKEEQVRTVLINPNIATVQTDVSMADTVYLEPLNELFVTRILEKERPSGILLGFGGQTALNLGLLLEERGVFARLGIEVLGTSVHSIRLTEDRELFKQELAKKGILTPKSYCVSNLKDALSAAEELTYPVMMRSGYSLGGLGSGKISSPSELSIRASEALSGSPQILIEEYLLGWKEIEYEIVRDQFGNAVTVCNMENFDAMGIHTGESIVIAPSQTLSNQEYHLLREVALRAAHHFEIVGECNIQYALHPKTGEYRVIEMNARLSRSSALASKATGYPLAFVATKLALGFALYEIENSVTKTTTAFFEPSLDYLVVKIPRWDTSKFRQADRTIGTEMKSVGEVMGIGRSFPEALQKAIRMLNIGCHGLSDYRHEITDIEGEISKATDRRLFALYAFFLQGGTVEHAHNLSQIDPWFLSHLHAIASLEQEMRSWPLSKDLLIQSKKFGFSDFTIGQLQGSLTEDAIRQKRITWNITPYVKQIDTLAGEFSAETNYLYMTYHGSCHDLLPSIQSSLLIIGSGPYCIGSSVEFDWCAVNTARTARKLGKSVIMINSNPETVSTDYDESDRLYFEELTLERISDIAAWETLEGAIIAMGGQIANNLVIPLHKAGFPILGTSAICIDRAENREKFSLLLHTLDIDQPAWEKVSTLPSAKTFAKNVGYPVLIRPSYVLSGAAMNTVWNEEELEKYLAEASVVSKKHPVVISSFITDAKELEIDGVAYQGEILIEAISEHIENAGVHSGDATIVLPPQRLYLETIRRAKKISRKIAQALAITGPFNIQFIAKNNMLKVIECNLRASRSFPFVSKVTGHNFIEIATQALLGQHTPVNYETLELDYVGVKTSQFSYNRLKGANPVANVEMTSTGEVACLGNNLGEAFVKSWLATEQQCKGKSLLVSIGGDKKPKLLDVLRELDQQGWKLYATAGTHEFLAKHGITSHFLYKASQKKEPNVLSAISGQMINLIVNIPTHMTNLHHTDGFRIRRLAIDYHIPLITNLQQAILLLECLHEIELPNIPILSWQEYRSIETKEWAGRLL